MFQISFLSIFIFCLASDSLQLFFSAKYSINGSFPTPKITSPASSMPRCAALCSTKSHRDCFIFRFDGTTCYIYKYLQVTSFQICSNCTADPNAVVLYYRKKQCEEGWFPSFDEVSCYKYFGQKMKQHHSEAFCQSLAPNCHLATIRTTQDNDKIVQEVSQATNDAVKDIYIKLKDFNRELVYTWNDEFEAGLRLWAEGQPSYAPGVEPCVLIYTGLSIKRGQWNNIPCYLTLPFACEVF